MLPLILYTAHWLGGFTFSFYFCLFRANSQFYIDKRSHVKYATEMYKSQLKIHYISDVAGTKIYSSEIHFSVAILCIEQQNSEWIWLEYPDECFKFMFSKHN